MADFDISKTELGAFEETDAHELANLFRSDAVSSESVDVGGSRYHMVVADVANATEFTSSGGAESPGESAAASDTVLTQRITRPTDSAAASETVIGSRSHTITVNDGATAVDASVVPFVATVADSAVVIATPNHRLIASVSSAADVTTVALGARQSEAVIDDRAGVSDLQRAPSSQTLTDTAAVGDAVTVKRRIVEQVVENGVAAADTASASRYHVAEILDRANCTIAVTLGTTATAIINDTAEAGEYVRLPSGQIANLFTNAYGAAARWEGLPFNSMVEADGVVYGAGADGLFVLEDGLDDIDTPIDSEVRYDLDTFGSKRRKRLGGIYIAAASPGPFTVRVSNEQGVFDYPTRLPRGLGATNHRAEPGRGLESAYFRIAVLASTDFGADRVIVDYQDTVRSI